MPANPIPTLITLALQTEVRSGARVWNLHDDDGNLIGWSPDLPKDNITNPGCISYTTGHSVPVTFAAFLQSVPLP